MEQALKVVWRDAKKWPKCAPNPAYPNGIDLDVSEGATRTCTAKLPHPAKRIGSYLVDCPTCGASAACTTAGRPDDPRSLKIACKAKLQ